MADGILVRAEGGRASASGRSSLAAPTIPTLGDQDESLRQGAPLEGQANRFRSLLRTNPPRGATVTSRRHRPTALSPQLSSPCHFEFGNRSYHRKERRALPQGA